MVFAGTPDVSVTALSALLHSHHDVVAVVTRPDAARGRGRAVERSPIGVAADSAGIPVLTPASPREPAFARAIEDLAPDCCPVVAYGAILPPSVLQIPRLGWVNLHFSLLPAWRGAAPVQWSLLSGDDVTGATVFRIGPGLDDGPVLGTLTERVRGDDTAGALLDRLSIAGAELLVATLDALETGAIHPAPQSSEGVSLAPKLTVDDARVRWSDPWVGVDRRIRAVTPAPGAWTTIAGERLGIGPLAHGEAPSDPLSPGAVHVTKRAVWVGTATEPALLDRVRPSGRTEMAAADWARGLRVEELRFT